MTLAEALAGKRIGVVLSAGYFGFYGHTGFVQGLAERGVQATAWAGTSAGGMVAAFAAAGLAPARIRELVLAQRREHFWDPDYLGAAVDAVKQGHRASGLLKGDRFAAILRDALPVSSFEALKTPLLLVATNLTRQAPEVLATGDLPSAVHATCAYPGLFKAVRRGDALLWDGGIVDKAPALALAESPAGRGLDALLSCPAATATRSPAAPSPTPAAWPRASRRSARTTSASSSRCSGPGGCRCTWSPRGSPRCRRRRCTAGSRPSPRAAPRPWPPSTPPRPAGPGRTDQRPAYCRWST